MESIQELLRKLCKCIVKSDDGLNYITTSKQDTPEPGPDPDPPTPPEPEKPDLDTFDPNVPFCIENIGDVPVEIQIYNYSRIARNHCQISYDLKLWGGYELYLDKSGTGGGEKILLANKGDRVYVKADTVKNNTQEGLRIKVANSSNDTKIRARGNIISLNKGSFDIYKTNYLTIDEAGKFKNLFMDCSSLYQAPELPATTLATYCYSLMFLGCTNLKTAPELPATTLANYCYESMFRNCTSLTQAPELPATTLANYCYQYMFYGCTSLTQAPDLPVTKLVKGCYYYMFDGCAGLTQAPDLLATTLEEHCYFSMFKGCTKLNYVKCLATKTSATDCTKYWLEGVATTGDFYTPASTTWSSGANGIPSGWTRHNIT